MSIGAAPRIDAANLIASLRINGFGKVEGLLTTDQAERARAELEEWFACDLAEREVGCSGTVHEGAFGRSHFDGYAHIVEDVFGKSPALDQMFETVLTDPTMAEVHERLAGKYLKMR